MALRLLLTGRYIILAGLQSQALLESRQVVKSECFDFSLLTLGRFLVFQLSQRTLRPEATQTLDCISRITCGCVTRTPRGTNSSYLIYR